MIILDLVQYATVVKRKLIKEDFVNISINRPADMDYSPSLRTRWLDTGHCAKICLWSCLCVFVTETKSRSRINHAKHFLAGHSGQSRPGKMGLSRPYGEPIRAKDLVQTTYNMNKGHIYLPSCYKAPYSENAPLLFLS